MALPFSSWLLAYYVKGFGLQAAIFYVVLFVLRGDLLTYFEEVKALGKDDVRVSNAQVALVRHMAFHIVRALLISQVLTNLFFQIFIVGKYNTLAVHLTLGVSWYNTVFLVEMLSSFPSKFKMPASDDQGYDQGYGQNNSNQLPSTNDKDCMDCKESFGECKSVNECKTKYRDLARIHHPDKGGTTEMMQKVNNCKALFARHDNPCRLQGENATSLFSAYIFSVARETVRACCSSGR